MKALICPSLGPAETLKVMDIDPPTPRQGEVVVEIVYAALNFFDTLIIEGKYQLKPEPPFSPAGEFAGRIAALGPGVDRLCGRRPGDGLDRLRRGARTDRDRGEPARPCPGRPAARQGRGPVDRLRHDAACAEAARRDQARRDARRARRLRRGGAGGGRDRQGDGGARDRLRLLGRQARIRPPLRRRRRRSITRPRISAPG